ncbi:MAG TPA: alpha/beta fold hydrolase [Kofleriaceae bacterium]|nr:alpha/beta fold hydrolase [Kofleriaceae bacterium]
MTLVRSMGTWHVVGTVLTVIVIALVAGVLAIALLAAVRWRTPGTPGVPPEPVIARTVAAPDLDIVPVPAWSPVVRGPPLPVVLVHGLFGFDRIGVPGARFDYFRGIAKHLGTIGCHAHAVRLPAAGSVPARARELVAAIEALPHDRIDLIAHSLGGLDARYALTHLGLAKRVRSLVTVGTPHRGTPIADLAMRGPLDWARRMVRALGMPLEALEWLSTDALAEFNAQVLDVPGVRYACVVGGMHRDDSVVPLALAPAHTYLRRVAGPNDGLVPVASQYWGELLAEIEADHFAQIGWRVAVRGTFDAQALYAFVVARLGDTPRPADAATSPRPAGDLPS